MLSFVMAALDLTFQLSIHSGYLPSPYAHQYRDARDLIQSTAIVGVIVPDPTSPSLSQPVILGLDPGRQKCGLAIMGVDRILRYQEVVAVEAVLATVEQLRRRFPISTIVLGDQTGSQQWKESLSKLEDPPRIMLVDERYTSLEARDRYWQMYPPAGLAKLLPQSLRTIPRPIDDIVAILLIERYLNRLTENLA